MYLKKEKKKNNFDFLLQRLQALQTQNIIIIFDKKMEWQQYVKSLPLNRWFNSILILVPTTHKIDPQQDTFT